MLRFSGLAAAKVKKYLSLRRLLVDKHGTRNSRLTRSSSKKKA